MPLNSKISLVRFCQQVFRISKFFGIKFNYYDKIGEFYIKNTTFLLGSITIAKKHDKFPLKHSEKKRP